MRERGYASLSAFCLAIGTAGVPLEPLRIIAAAILCYALAFSGKYIAAASLVAVIVAGWLQHGQFRVTLLAGAAILGLVIRLFANSDRARLTIAAMSAVTGAVFLFLG